MGMKAFGRRRDARIGEVCSVLDGLLEGTCSLYS